MFLTEFLAVLEEMYLFHLGKNVFFLQRPLLSMNLLDQMSAEGMSRECLHALVVDSATVATAGECARDSCGQVPFAMDAQ